jgi:protein phosphatase
MSTVHAAHTHVGLRRKRNEDAFYAASDSNLYVICDGMGGHQEGQLAARTTVETVVGIMRKGGWIGTDDVKLRIAGQALELAIQTAHRALMKASEQLGLEKHMGTTVAAVLVVGEKAVIASVGDSRVYLINAEGHRRLTRDHTLAQKFADLGIIGPSEVHRHPYRGVLVQCVGVPSRCLVDVKVAALHPGDRLLLCTDGLSDVVDESSFIAAARTRGDLTEITSELIRLTLTRGARDNVTVILVEAESDASGREEAA